MKLASGLALLVLAILAASSNAAIINGGFEDELFSSLNGGSFSGWTVEAEANGLCTVDGYASLSVHAFVDYNVPAFIQGLDLTQSFFANEGETLIFDVRALQTCDDAYSSENLLAWTDISVYLRKAEGGYEDSMGIPDGPWTTMGFQPFVSSGKYTVIFRAHADAINTQYGSPDYAPGSPDDYYLQVSADLDIDNVRLEPVPEPSTLALLIAGCVGLIGWAWKRRKIG